MKPQESLWLSLDYRDFAFAPTERFPLHADGHVVDIANVTPASAASRFGRDVAELSFEHPTSAASARPA